MKAYDLQEVRFVLGGIVMAQQKGRITITPRAKRITAKVGNDGEATISKNGDKSCDVKIQCMQSSDINAKLSAMMLLVENSPAGTLGIMPIEISDGSGLDTFVALNAIVTGWPEKVYEAESGDREWEIFVADPEQFAGGN